MNRSRLGDAGLVVAALLSVAVTIAVTVGGVRTVRVLTASMTPAFSPGDLLVTRAVRVDELRPGSVVVLPMDDGTPYAHRVVSVRVTDDGAEIRTRGDANAADDPWVVEVHDVTVPSVAARVPMSWLPQVLLDPARLRWLLAAGVLVLVVSGARRERARSEATPHGQP